MPTIRTLSCFSGIGGLDLGLESGGCEIVAQCESWEPARRVLQRHWPHLEIYPDVATLVPDVGAVDLIAAGFPCTDISHVGSKAGITGSQSGLVEHVFRLSRLLQPRWVLLENVPNLLVLHSAAGIRHLTAQFERLGYRWAYRVVDARFTGVPQRRPRVLVLASSDGDPADVLLGEDAGNHEAKVAPPEAGFYWTEGRHGTGLVFGAVPTLKGGSTIGLPSAPAVWFPRNPHGRRFLLPSVEDGEALQGLPRGWTRPAVRSGEPDHRWKLIGNAVPTGIGAWVAERITGAAGSPSTSTAAHAVMLDRHRQGRWPDAAWGCKGTAWRADVSRFPRHSAMIELTDIIRPFESSALSHRATSGFLRRLDESRLKVPADFYADLEHHQSETRPVLTKQTSTWPTTDATRARMSRQPQRDTRPEMLLRRALFARGFRYRVQYRPVRDLRRRLDIVFTRARVAVDVRGCFWHACPAHGSNPTLNADRWQAKLNRNAARDADTEAILVANGWTVIVVWEHDDIPTAADCIAHVVQERLSSASCAGIVRVGDGATGGRH
ncbi:DNA mismatch endonuclease Vsr [Mycolicibacterium wolinskyi]|uniref:DNA mismatch endonuclease Vsr n=1 Tax=Mycolicibacterium wolinskyi TaxID=59750 RepID=UPI003917B5CF